jgi:hypothetical protein
MINYAFYDGARYMHQQPIYEDNENVIFVFGSNTGGYHGKGAAKTALERYGAVYGVGEGLRGRSYALPTVLAVPNEEQGALFHSPRRILRQMPLGEIERHIAIFKDFAASRPELLFFVSAVGTNLAGYTHQDIAPLFEGASANCHFPHFWSEYLLGV